MRDHHRGNCGCCNQEKEIVHPTREDMVHCCSEEVVRHVHPSHTTVMNHHLIKNEHVYPHTVSQQYTQEETDINKQEHVAATAEDYCKPCQEPHNHHHRRRQRGFWW